MLINKQNRREQNIRFNNFFIVHRLSNKKNTYYITHDSRKREDIFRKVG